MGTNGKEVKSGADISALGQGTKTSEEAQQTTADTRPLDEMVSQSDPDTHENHAFDEGQAGLDRGVQSHLGRLIRASYQTLVDEPVPPELLKLLEDLERTEDPR